mgnify:CR=1 FL=1
MTDAIAYQGEPGSNSHIACREVRPDWEAVPCASFEDAFAQVTSGQAKLAMIPIDNSIAGRVADIHAMLPNTTLQIIEEHFLRIRFSLLGIPGTSIDQAKEVHSHIHALGQCRKLIRELGLKPVIAGDTAGSAREVSEWKDPSKVSLAPPMAAELYGLDVLAHDAEDDPTNTTRFVVLADKQPIPSREELAGRAVQVGHVRRDVGRAGDPHQLVRVTFFRCGGRSGSRPTGRPPRRIASITSTMR